jgi:flagellar basal body-associated protein FliL
LEEGLMAKFCAKCGCQMDDADKVCGQCGTPVAGSSESVAENSESVAGSSESVVGSPAPAAPVTNGKSKKKIVKLIIGVIVAIIAVVIIANVAVNYIGYKGTINKMVKALKNNDTATLESMASSISEEEFEKQYGARDTYEDGETGTYKDVYDYYDEVISNTLDKYEDSVGIIKKITYEITDETELSDRRVDELKDDLEKLYDNMDASVIKKVVGVDIKITVKGSKKSSAYDVDNLYMIKEDDGWKVFYGYLDY